jgi:hypothetical protein
MIHFDVLEEPTIENELGMVGRSELPLLRGPDGGLARHIGDPVADVMAENFKLLGLLS